MSRYKSTSVYAETPTRGWYLDLWRGMSIRPSDNDTPYIIPSEFHHRPDLASHHFYNRVEFWYVFALRNNNIIKDPIYDFVAGLEIFVPSKEDIEGF